MRKHAICEKETNEIIGSQTIIDIGPSRDVSKDDVGPKGDIVVGNGLK